MRNLSIIILSGLPVSGKSAMAMELGMKLGLPVFSVDPIESAIIKSGINRSFETGLAAYLVAQTLAEEQLKLRMSVIIDAVNAEEEGKNIWRELAKNTDVKMIIIECALSDKSLYKSRVDNRVRQMHGISEITWDEVEARRHKYIQWSEPILKLDAVDAPETNLAKALDYIQSQSI